MQTKRLQIQGIPAILWGETSSKLFLYIHGQGGCKEEAEAFAGSEVCRSWQVLSIDLPGHGERKQDTENFVPWQVIPELKTVMDYAEKNWDDCALYANSIGAWLSMLAFQGKSFSQCLLVSPILDMEKIILNMMEQAHVTEEHLKQELNIPTSSGQTLSWAYLEYVRKNPVENWVSDTQILFAENDCLTEFSVVSDFILKFPCCHLTVMKNGEHWFHTKEQLEYLSSWWTKCLSVS